jgi:ketopantoate reductase
MKVCVIGAGAIGGMIAVKLALSGEEVSVVDRGAHLAAIRSNGLKLRWQDGTVSTAKVRAFDKSAEAGKQDLIVLAVKSYDLEEAVRDIAPLLGADTMVMTVQNGIPWWYFQREGGKFEGYRFASLDPRGVLSEAIDPRRLIGCVAYPAAALAPGIVYHIEGDRFPVGELDGQESERVKHVSDAFNRAGLRSRVISDIRAEIWLKAWGSLSFNPISALTHATMEEICRHPDTRKLAADMMAEAQVIAEKLGIRFRHTIEKRLKGAEEVGAHKTSMLQDLEGGHQLETEALVGSVLEIGRLTEIPTPAIATVYALLKLLENVLQASGGKLRVDRSAASKAA